MVNSRGPACTDKSDVCASERRDIRTKAKRVLPKPIFWVKALEVENTTYSLSVLVSQKTTDKWDRSRRLMAINFSFLSKLTTTTTPQSHYSLLHNNKHTQTHFILNRHSHRRSHQAYNISYTYLHIGRYTVLGTHTCTYVNTYLHTHTHP